MTATTDAPTVVRPARRSLQAIAAERGHTVLVVPRAAPVCSCGVVGGDGTRAPLIASHLDDEGRLGLQVEASVTVQHDGMDSTEDSAVALAQWLADSIASGESFSVDVRNTETGKVTVHQVRVVGGVAALVEAPAGRRG